MTGRLSSRWMISRIAAAFALLASGCIGVRAPAPDGAAVERAGTAVAVTGDPFANPFIAAPGGFTADTQPLGIRFRLTDRGASGATEASDQPVTAAALTSVDAAALLERLAGPAPLPAERPGFRFATSSLPAPRPGVTTRVSFADAATGGGPVPVAAAPGPLRVLHMRPLGVVATVSQVALTFSRPMVAVSALTAVPASVRLSPSVAGSWRWLDPSTLVFESAGELPMATRYTVEVPAGFAAADGTRLREAVQWTFATSAPAVRDVVSTDVAGSAQPVIVVVFDQAVDAATVLPFLRLEIEGEPILLRAPTPDELVHRLVAGRMAVAPERSVAVVPAERVRTQTEAATWAARLRLAPGLPSLAGPERTERERVHEFRMRRSFGVVSHGCGRADVCVPGVPWTIRFTQPLRPFSDTTALVRVEPALPGATVEIWADHLVVLGSPRPNTTYTVRLDPSIASYGGELGDVPALEFAIGPAVPAVWTPGGRLAVLTHGSTAYPVLAEATDSVRVTVRAVSPADWPRYSTALDAIRAGVTELPALPGRVLFHTVVPTAPAGGGAAEAEIELAGALAAAGGHLLLVLSPATPPPARIGTGEVLTWVQRGGILLDVAEDATALTVRALSAAGQPLRGVGLELSNASVATRVLARGETGADGVAVITTPADSRPRTWLLVATHQGNSVVLPAALPGEPYCCYRYEWRPQLRRHFVTDRPLYAPGDTVRFAGWLRRVGGTGMEPASPATGLPVPYLVRDPRGATLAEDTLRMQPNGRLEGWFVLPPEVNAGTVFISLTLYDGSTVMNTSLPISIEEVRRPNFEVSLDVEPGPHLPGSNVAAAVLARYFTGGALPGTEVRWQVRTGPARYAPPGVADYSFGTMRMPRGRWVEPQTQLSRTDAAGAHRLGIDIDELRPAMPMQLHVQATVTDVDRQSRTSTATVLVHPAAVYVGLRTPSRFARAGESVTIDAAAFDLDGRAVAGRPIVLRALRQERRFEPNGALVVEDTERARCTLRSQTAPVRCTLRALPAGDYMMAATVADAAGRKNTTELALRVAGETVPAGARASRDSVAMTPDREQYVPGDTAIVLVETALRAAQALLSVRRGGVLESRAVRIENGIATVRLPITDAHLPNVQLHVTVVAADGRVATGVAPVTVVRDTRALTVMVEPQSDEVVPGGNTAVVVTVRDAAGRPVENADVVLSGIDEALLALSRRPVSDPLTDFYPTAGPAVNDRTLRTHAAPARFARDAAVRGAAGTITGVVLDGVSGRPVANAWVEVPRAGGAWTGVDGLFRIDDVPPGEHTLQARVQGYVTATMPRVTVSAGRMSRAHMLLLSRQAVLAGGAGFELNRIGAAALELNELVVSGRMEVESRAILPFTVAAALAPPPPASPAILLRSTPAAAGVLLRSDFTPVAAFVANARTGPDGRVQIPVTMPHSLTRYRLRAVAAAGERRFGAGEASLTVRRPLMVRTTPPRFLNYGDRFELPVLVENRSERALEVDVAVRAVNADMGGPVGRRVLVPANDRVELRFPVVAGAPGEARFQVAASAGLADAAEIAIPILLPVRAESFAVYGELDDARPVAYPLRLPAGTVPDQTRVHIGFATTAVHGLRDALDFLIVCYFDVPEVWASRIIALSALRDAPAAMPWPRDMIDARIRADVVSLARAQLQDGSWSIWLARFDADPFVSVHAAHALVRARAAGIDVPARTVRDALLWLERVDEFATAPPAQGSRPLPARPAFAADYPVQARRAVQAYALDVRRRFGHDVAASAAALLRADGPGALPAEALAWLLPALAADPEHTADAAELRRELDARVVRSAGTAAVVSPYDAGGRQLFYSPRRTDAVVLGALIDASAPNDVRAADGVGTASDVGATSDLVAALAHGLMAHRVRGRWSNTQENAFAVAALANYLGAAEATVPALVARAWAGPRLAVEQPFRGRGDGRIEVLVPADSLGVPGAELAVTMAREGAGRLYYRLALNYAAAGETPASARGFEVSRTYEAVDDPQDVRRDDNGTWRVRLGARVRVRVTVGTAGPRYHVALIDPLPAGFEAVNPSLAGTAGELRAPALTTRPSDTPLFYPEHVNVRADRFEAFRTLLQPGRHELSYVALATTPGDFAAPAPRAEELYAPETFGRGASERLVIEDRRAP